MILLTSFRRSRDLVGNWDHWSGAVYQPKGFKYPKAEWADIRDDTGRWTRPREFVDMAAPLEGYRDALWKLYNGRIDETDAWLYAVEASGYDVSLCCWCPYDRAAQRQLGEHGSFVCHTAVMGKFLEEVMKVSIKYDTDRDQMVKF